MTVTESVRNLRFLKDQALRLKSDMDYDQSVQIADFCTELIVKISDYEEASLTNVEPMLPRYLSMQDVSTPEKRDKILKDFGQRSTLNSYMYQIPDNSANDALQARAKIADFVQDENWPSRLFTGEEISLMALRLDDGAEAQAEVLDKINAAIAKSFAQESRLSDLKEYKPLDEMAQTFLAMNVAGSNRDGAFNEWALDEYKALAACYPDMPNYWLDCNLKEVETHCVEAKNAGYGNMASSISYEDKISLVSYGSFVAGNFFNIQERQSHNEVVLDVKDLAGERYDAFTRPIIKFLEKIGMSEDKILRVFDNLQKSAQKLLGRDNSAER